MLEVKQITKVYDETTVLKEINFEVKTGEILGYLGPDGAGKTTTLKILAGFLKPSSGEIYYQGGSIEKDFIEYKRKVGYVPEDRELYPHLSAFEYLQMIGRLYQIDEQIIIKRIAGLMEEFDLSADMHLPIANYSKVMKQKILLSAALINNPEILLLDEPLADLDVTSALILNNILKKLSEKDRIIVYSSHILEAVEEVCKRVIVINKGTIITTDSVKELRNLMDVPLLESIFQKVVQQKDIEKIAENIISIIQY